MNYQDTRAWMIAAGNQRAVKLDPINAVRLNR